MSQAKLVELNNIIDISRHTVKSDVSKIERRIAREWLMHESQADTAITLQLENLILTYGLDKVLNVLKQGGVK